MKDTKKLTISALTVALGVVFMVVGAVFQVLDLSTATLASLLVVFIYLEIGSPYTWLVWLCTSLGAFLLYPGSTMWLVYLLMFGIYPIVKGYIERLPRFLWLPLKLLFLNISLLLMVWLFEALVGVSFFGDPSEVIATFPFLSGVSPIIIYCVLWAFMNLIFVLFDKMIVVMVAFYYRIIRPKIEKLLK